MNSSNIFVDVERGVGFVNPDKDFVAYVKSEGTKLKVQVVNVEAAIPFSDELSYDSGKSFFEAVPLFTRFKAVILNVYNEESHGYANNLEFCSAVREEFKKLNLKYTFISSTDFLLLSTLIGANITDINLGDTVFSCVISNQNIVCTRYKFKKNGYMLTSFKNINLKQSYAEIRDAIFDSSDPKKIILAAAGPNDPLVKTLKKIVNSKCSVVVENGLGSYIYAAVIELYKRMTGKLDPKKYILPTSPREYRIGCIMGDKFLHCLRATDQDTLPFSNTMCSPRSSLDMSMTYRSNDTLQPVYLQRFNLPKTGHRFEITLNVDEEGYPSYEVAEQLMDEVKCIPEKLNRTGLQIPVISFFDNSSVITVYKEGKGYQFLDSWGGIHGKELLIAFDKSKPTFFEDAAEALRTKPSFVITDFTELMANTAERLTLPWPFKITRDEKNPVLVEFDNFGGTRKLSTPSFLMALLLKQHIKVLKEAGIGEEGLKNIGFHFVTFDKNRDFEKWKRLDKSMKETCQLLKINWNEDTKIII